MTMSLLFDRLERCIHVACANGLPVHEQPREAIRGRLAHWLGADIGRHVDPNEVHFRLLSLIEGEDEVSYSYEIEFEGGE